MEEKKKKKKPGKAEALAHIERIRVYGHAYYRKADVLKILREFISLYWR